MARWLQVLLELLARKEEGNCAPVVYLKCGPISFGSFVTIVLFIPGVVRSVMYVPSVPNLLDVTIRQRSCDE